MKKLILLFFIISHYQTLGCPFGETPIIVKNSKKVPMWDKKIKKTIEKVQTLDSFYPPYPNSIHIEVFTNEKCNNDSVELMIYQQIGPYEWSDKNPDHHSGHTTPSKQMKWMKSPIFQKNLNSGKVKSNKIVFKNIKTDPIFKTKNEKTHVWAIKVVVKIKDKKKSLILESPIVH